MPLRVQLFLLLGILILPDAVTSEFLTTPVVAWTHDLPDPSINVDQQQRQQQPQLRQLQQQQQGSTTTSRIGRGNAVTVSPDGSQIFVTESNGALHMVGASATTTSSGTAKRSSWTFAPNATQSSSASDTATTSTTVMSCHGGLAFYGDDLVVYAVTESPVSSTGDDSYDASTQLATSQILGVRVRTGTLAWSVSVGGIVVGTPWISQNHAYVVRNTAANGYVTVLEIGANGKDAAAVATIPDPAAGSASALGWLGPLAGHAVTLNGADRDVVVVALASSPDATSGESSNSNGNGGGNNNGPNNNNNNQGNTVSQGGLYAVVPSADYDSLSGQTADAYDLRIISSYPLLTDLPPVFDGTSVYLAHQGRLSGWEGADQDLSSVFDGTNQDRSPSWETRRSDNSGSTTGTTSFSFANTVLACSTKTHLIPHFHAFLIFTFKCSRAPQCSLRILHCCWFRRPAQDCRAETLHRAAPCGVTRTAT
jgi:hypothetical protein